MKDHSSFIVALVLIAIATALGVKLNEYLFSGNTPDPQVFTELDRSIEQVQKLIDAEQTRLGGKGIVATPPDYRGADKLDISIKLQYLLWKLDVAIMLQKIRPDEKPGMPIGETISGEALPGVTFTE